MAEFMLSIPFKNGTELDSAKLGEVLKAEFKLEGFCKDSASGGIEEFTKTRSQLIAAKFMSLTTLELYQRYNDHILYLVDKIPKVKYLYSTNLVFCWDDAFEKGGLFGRKSYTASSFFEVERLCVLFNIAALQSALANESMALETDEGLKNAAKLYQNAGSVLYLILDALKSIPEGTALSPDLFRDTLAALQSLMLAQAQEAFVTKAIKDGMKSGIIAKLCAQASDLYTSALLLLAKDTCKNLWERNWVAIVEAKSLGYSSLANYHQSQVCASKKQYGEQIGRLELTIRNLKKAGGRIGSAGYLANVLADAEGTLKTAKRDNDFIYHEVVPPADALGAIELVASARLAKLNAELPNAFVPDGVDIFSSALRKGAGAGGDAPSLKQIFNTAATGLGNYLVKLGNK